MPRSWMMMVISYLHLIMGKSCNADDCPDPIWGGGYCRKQKHQEMRTDRPYLLAQIRKKEKEDLRRKNFTRIAPVSAKRKRENKEYKIHRDVFLTKPENKKCRVFPHLDSNQVHHMWGRENERLLDERYWLAVSQEGHNFIGDFPDEAYERGWSLYRNQNPVETIS